MPDGVGDGYPALTIHGREALCMTPAASACKNSQKMAACVVQHDKNAKRHTKFNERC